MKARFPGLFGSQRGLPPLMRLHNLPKTFASFGCLCRHRKRTNERIWRYGGPFQPRKFVALSNVVPDGLRTYQIFRKVVGFTTRPAAGTPACCKWPNRELARTVFHKKNPSSKGGSLSSPLFTSLLLDEERPDGSRTLRFCSGPLPSSPTGSAYLFLNQFGCSSARFP